MKISKLSVDTTTEMLVGTTGCGKTYTAINKSTGKILIAVPTRQLAYEIMVDYDRFTVCNTGEVNINLRGDKMGGSQVCVYENIPKTLDTYDTIIIDECHFINDEDRGLLLLNNIIRAKNLGVNVLLLTATDSLSVELKKLLNIKVKEMRPYKTVIKRQVDDLDEIKKLSSTKSTLIFTKYVPDIRAKVYYADLLNIHAEDIATISADTPTSERLELQLAYKRGDIKVMLSTNVLAQGVNFPAEVVIIEYNEWDDWEVIEQKIGRCGRPQYSNQGFYFLLERGKKVKRNYPKEKDIVSIPLYNGIDIGHLKLQEFQIPHHFTSYSGFKYSKKLLTYLGTLGILNKEERTALKFIRDEELNVLNIIKRERGVYEYKQTLRLDNPFASLRKS